MTYAQAEAVLRAFMDRFSVRMDLEPEDVDWLIDLIAKQRGTDGTRTGEH